MTEESTRPENVRDESFTAEKSSRGEGTAATISGVTEPEWLQGHRLIISLVRAMRQMGSSAEWPPWMEITPDDVLVDLPFTPPCRHVRPHTRRACETEEALVSYLTFKQLGWERAGYCWHYVPAFLHEWFGCGPDQELFIRGR